MPAQIIFLFIIGIILILLLVYLLKRKKGGIQLMKSFPNEWKNILSQKVNFYQNLKEEEKKRFERKVLQFLINTRITGIDTEANDTDKLLIAASAIIPIFSFPDWHYPNLDEVLLYPQSFNDTFETSGEKRNILGMVGSGYMEGKMILSKPSIYQGFLNEADKKNTAIHEFVHLIDKADGVIDGVPSILLEKQYIIPWIDLINKEIIKIFEGQSDINPYGGSNNVEFFAVAGEYFFERPALLYKKHPELYNMLEKIFIQPQKNKKSTELDEMTHVRA